jgi:hypothetical protein
MNDPTIIRFFIRYFITDLILFSNRIQCAIDFD